VAVNRVPDAAVAMSDNTLPTSAGDTVARLVSTATLFDMMHTAKQMGYRGRNVLRRSAPGSACPPGEGWDKQMQIGIDIAAAMAAALIVAALWVGVFGYLMVVY
jgi:hypothetical protein